MLGSQRGQLFPHRRSLSPRLPASVCCIIAAQTFRQPKQADQRNRQVVCQRTIPRELRLCAMRLAELNPGKINTYENRPNLESNVDVIAFVFLGIGPGRNCTFWQSGNCLRIVQCGSCEFVHKVLRLKVLLSFPAPEPRSRLGRDSPFARTNKKRMNGREIPPLNLCVKFLPIA